MTPILSPYRLAAASQYRRVLAGELDVMGKPGREDSPLHYLRFGSGAYGRHRLEELALVQNHTDAARIRESASAALKSKNPWQPIELRSSEDLVSRLKLYPAGKSLDAGLAQRLRADFGTAASNENCLVDPARQLTGLFVDLNADGVDEFILFNVCSPRVYQRLNGSWRQVANANDRTGPADPTPSRRTLQTGTCPPGPPWQDLWIGKHHFQVEQIYGRAPQRPAPGDQK